MVGLDFGLLKPVEMPSLLDSQQKAASLASIGMQQQRMGQQMQNDQLEAHLKKASVFGNALEGLSGLPEAQRAQAYGQVRNELVGQGVIKPEQAPEQYDPQFYSASLMRYRQTAPAIEEQLKKAQIQKLRAETDRDRAEAAKKNPGISDFSDPAKLVANFVPKEHQAQAFKEVDAAENTRRMSQAIMEAFDQAALDTGGTGAVTSYLKTPRSVLALHQAMQPTFKDLEGTVRQAAMDNTFKNISPSGADNKQDIATKRAALQDYLQSKLAAPTARAYGIDLTKFPSTAAYTKPAPEGLNDRKGLSEVLLPSAQAAAPAIRPGHVEGGYLYMGGDPANPKSWKKAGQ